MVPEGVIIMRTLVGLAAAACATLLSSTTLASERPPDTVLEWNAIMLETTTGQNPFFQARFAATTQVAVFEAVNAIDQDYDPYLGTVRAPRTASTEAAAAVAAHDVLKNYFPASAATLDAALALSLDRVRNLGSKLEGIEVGAAAARAMIDLRTDDGSAPPEFHLPASMAPGEWQPTPGCPPAGGILKQWRNLRPFSIETTDQFRLQPPPQLTSERYARDLREVQRVGGIDSPYRPQDRSDVARFYAATAPVRVFNTAAGQIAVQQRRSLSENARALALVDMAISDALAAVFDTKYHYTFWRPETAIRAADADGNPLTRADPDFIPFIVTPCFPSYASAHASGSNAARAVLERLYGPRHHDITLSNPAVANVMLHYDSFKQITDDIDDARIYGGIHYRFDQEGGAHLGRQVGTYVYRHTLRRAYGKGNDDAYSY
jgi:hypothetical protein